MHGETVKLYIIYSMLACWSINWILWLNKTAPHLNITCFKHRIIQELRNCYRHSGCEIECILLITKKLRMIKYD
jgi:hypothetical protein